MNRLRAFLPALFLAFSLLTVLPVPAQAAANLPGLDPDFSIVPLECRACPCGYTGALQLIQNLMNAGIAIGVIAFVIVIAYAGIMFMVNPTNPEMRSKARGMLINVVVGMIILLTAWLVVDFIMKTLYKDSSYGPWNRILSPAAAEAFCIQPMLYQPHIGGLTGGLLNGIVGGQGGTGTIGTGGGGGAGTVGTARGLCSEGNTACSVSAIQALGLSTAQAQAMSCIAVTESSGNPNTPNSSTGACGTFQITNQTSRGNWRNPAFHRAPCSAATSCNNAACNLQTAVLMFRSVGYQPWTGVDPRTGRPWNPNAVACVARYDPGH